MEKEYKISVVVPVYNVEKYLARCIESIIEQPYKQWEIILVNDGSTDTSPQLCDEYSLKDSRIKVIHQINKGVSAARNRGIEESTGDILIFVDADDWISKDAFATILQEWSDDIEIIKFEHYEVLNNEEVTWRKYVNSGNLAWKKESDETKRWLKQAICYLHREELYAIYFGMIWGCAYNTKRLKEEKIRFVENAFYGEDVVFVMECLSNFRNFKYISKPIYYYFLNNNSVTQTKNKKNISVFIDNMNLLDQHIKHIKGIEEETLLNYLYFSFAQLVFILYKLPGYDDRKSLEAGRRFCAEKANRILSNMLEGISFVDRILLIICKLRLIPLIEVAVRIKVWIKKNLIRTRV